MQRKQFFFNINPGVEKEKWMNLGEQAQKEVDGNGGK
jgi:hypothetical protein